MDTFVGTIWDTYWLLTGVGGHSPPWAELNCVRKTNKNEPVSELARGIPHVLLYLTGFVWAPWSEALLPGIASRPSDSCPEFPQQQTVTEMKQPFPNLSCFWSVFCHRNRMELEHITNVTYSFLSLSLPPFLISSVVTWFATYPKLALNFHPFCFNLQRTACVSPCTFSFLDLTWNWNLHLRNKEIHCFCSKHV